MSRYFSSPNSKLPQPYLSGLNPSPQVVSMSETEIVVRDGLVIERAHAMKGSVIAS